MLRQDSHPNVGFFREKNQSINEHDVALEKLADNYFEQCYLYYRPTLATQLGLHAYDNQLEDFDQINITHYIQSLKKFLTLFESIPVDALSSRIQANYELLVNSIHSQLLTLEVIKPWEKNPNFYLNLINESLFALMARQFAPLEDRVKNIIAREHKIIDLLNAAKKNIQNPPLLFTQMACDNVFTIIDFFINDLENVVKDCKNSILLEEFKLSNTAVINALKQFQTWLNKDVLPESKGDYRIGTEVYHKKLQYDEMVDTPLDELLEMNRKNLKKNQDEFKRIAQAIDPNKSVDEILAQSNTMYPAPDKLLAAFRDNFDQLIQFINEKNILTIDSDVKPMMQDSPPFLRWASASMDTPGPFEVVAKEAYFNVTLPNPDWSKEKIQDYMKEFTHGRILSTVVHETYPGHYIQLLWMQKNHDRVRKMLSCNSNVEGWAHYCEQMMLEEGLAEAVTYHDTVAENYMRLGQLLDALLRNARFEVGIRLHNGTMSFEEALDFFVIEGYQSRTLALGETKRATHDPTYLYYTLGKLQILKLRDDLRQQLGTSFNLKAFHDHFLQEGLVPIKLICKAMLSEQLPCQNISKKLIINC